MKCCKIFRFWKKTGDVAVVPQEDEDQTVNKSNEIHENVVVDVSIEESNTPKKRRSKIINILGNLKTLGSKNNPFPRESKDKIRVIKSYRSVSEVISNNNVIP